MFYPVITKHLKKLSNINTAKTTIIKDLFSIILSVRSINIILQKNHISKNLNFANLTQLSTYSFTYKITFCQISLTKNISFSVQ